MAIPLVQLADGAIAFLPVTRLRTRGAARTLFFSALVPTCIAVRVIVFNTLCNDRLQALLRIRLAIIYPSNRFSLSPDYQAQPLSSLAVTEQLPG
jgi:hypothetical protein